ncbi:WD40 repeat domain-containing protein [Flagellimonas onchidii]|uniref:WD40 repeat domain-containing protein n=1 Tax=Flagellimonas onchidii TaxID=2562684 RepID=UPI0010A66D04|nr:WD40 repeat domain-containing protein [Allomuricauda onchidii]
MRLSVFVFSFFLSCFVYTQEKILQFGHSGRISTYAISQDNLSLATGGFDDGKVILWDINLRAIKQVFQTYGNAIDDIVFSEDNKKMACIDGGGNIFIWNIISQKLEFQFEPGKYGPTKMKSLTSKNLTPSKSIINGGKLIFIEDSLYVGSNFTYNGVQSSLFKISLDDGKVMAMGNIPEIQNTFINIKRLEKVDDKALIIYSNPNFFEHYVFIYSTLTEDIERYIFKSQKDKIEDISINSKQGLLAISIEKNNYDDNETLVFDLQTGKKVDKINEYGKLTWEGNNLWIGHIDTFKNYNFSARRFENQFEFQGFVRDFNYLSKHQKILVQNNEGLTLIEPLKFNLITHTNRWEGKKKNGIQCQYITHMEFLDDQNILVQSGETFHCNTSSQNLGKYIWDSKYNTFKEVFAGQKQSIIRGYNKKRKLVFGNYLDSTKIQKNFIGKEEFVYSTYNRGDQKYRF